MMNNILIWSGGFDSTCLLYKLLLDHKITEEITLIHLEHASCGETKCNREYAACMQLLPIFQKAFPEIEFNYVTISIHVDGPDKLFRRHSNGLVQPSLWIMNILPFLESNSNIYFGYIANDDAVAYKHIMQEIVDSNCKYSSLHDIKVKYPLEHFSKSMLIDWLFHHQADNDPIAEAILEHCTTCENLKENDWCGVCTPCIHFLESCMMLMVDGSYPTKYKELIHQYLKDKMKKDVNISITNLQQEYIIEEE